MTLDSDPLNMAVVLAAHGIPPTDYPPRRVGALMMLEFGPKWLRRVGFVRTRHRTLAREVRTWPRTEHNDPYKMAVDDLASRLSSRLGVQVATGYNEFCAPTVEEAIEQVIADGARRVFVLPTMLVRGNTHTESEIYGAVVEAGHRHPNVHIRYAWPFDPERLVSLFADQVIAHLEPSAG